MVFVMIPILTHILYSVETTYGINSVISNNDICRKR
jgi:hypothetical protein